MSLPDWNDLPTEARRAACVAARWWEADGEGQCALEIYNAIREHVPPEVFPLFQQPTRQMKSKDGLAPCPFCGGEASFGSVTYSPHMVKEQGWSQATFHCVNCVRCGADNQGITGHRTRADAANRWNTRVTDTPPRTGLPKGTISQIASGATKPRVRVPAGRRVR